MFHIYFYDWIFWGGITAIFFFFLKVNGVIKPRFDGNLDWIVSKTHYSFGIKVVLSGPWDRHFYYPDPKKFSP